MRAERRWAELRWQKILRIAALILGLIALWRISTAIDWQASFRQIRLLEPWQILVIFIFPLTYYLAASLRIAVILKYLGYPIPFRKALEMSTASFAASYILPSFDAAGKSAEFVLIMRSARGINASTAALALLLEGIAGSGTDLIARTALFFLLGLAALLGNPVFQTALGLSLLPLVIFLLPLIPPRIVERAIKARRFVEEYAKIRKQYLSILANPVKLAIPMTISLAGFVLGLAEFLVIGKFLGISVDPKLMFLSYTAFRIVLIMPTAGAIGAIEGALVGIFWSVGQNPVSALAMAMAFRMKEIFWVVIGLSVLAKNGIGIFKLSRQNSNH